MSSSRLDAGPRFAATATLFDSGAPEPSLEDLLVGVVAAVQEIRSLQGDSNAVNADPVVRLLVHELHRRCAVDMFDYGVHAQAMAAAATSKDKDLDTALLRDGEFAMGGAVNVGAMMSSLLRHAQAFTAAGRPDDWVSHPGTAGILTQCADLLRLVTPSMSERAAQERADVLALVRAKRNQQAVDALLAASARPAPAL